MSSRRRPPITGTLTVVRFNWPKYVGAGGLVVAAIVARVMSAGPILQTGLGVAAVLAIAWSASSILATWWVYDHAHVYERAARGLGAVGAWATVHTGFDAATPVLAATLAAPPAAVHEVGCAGRSSLRRARVRVLRDDEGDALRTAGRSVEPRAARQVVHRTDVGAGGDHLLPGPDGSLDTVFLTFAVHEVRDRDDQRALFADIHRVLRPGGRLVVTEHLRDLANGAVFGPGSLHFQRADVWRTRAAESGFDLVAELAVTPFVRRFTWRR